MKRDDLKRGNFTAWREVGWTEERFDLSFCQWFSVHIQQGQKVPRLLRIWLEKHKGTRWERRSRQQAVLVLQGKIDDLCR
jgi:hypothetical protein